MSCRRHARWSLLVALPLVALLAGCGSGSGTTAATGSPSGSSTSSAKDLTASLHGAIPDHLLDRPDFTLHDTSGAPYDFIKKTKDRVTLLYFGYTHCPDECPTTMHDVGTALKKLPADVSAKVDAIFVTTDPARDTPSVLRKWLDQFNPAIVGLTGTQAQIATAEEAAGVGLASPEPVPSELRSTVGDYAVDHSAALLVYGHRNRVVELFLAGATTEDYLADLPLLVKEKSA